MTARATVRDRIDGDLDASMSAWQHLRVRALTSPLVCKALFAKWQICVCGRCIDDPPGGGQ